MYVYQDVNGFFGASKYMASHVLISTGQTRCCQRGAMSLSPMSR